MPIFTFVRPYPVYKSFHIMRLFNHRRHKSPLRVKGKVKLVYKPGKCLHQRMFDSIQTSRRGSFSSVQQVTVRGKIKYNEHRSNFLLSATQTLGADLTENQDARKTEPFCIHQLCNSRAQLSLTENKHPF